MPDVTRTAAPLPKRTNTNPAVVAIMNQLGNCTFGSTVLIGLDELGPGEWSATEVAEETTRRFAQGSFEPDVVSDWVVLYNRRRRIFVCIRVSQYDAAIAASQA